MSNNQSKLQSAMAAIELIQALNKKSITLGIGTGSTVNYFIDNLVPLMPIIDAVASSSQESTHRAAALGIDISNNNSLSHIDIYVDGADEINAKGEMIKGGGGAQTSEKIIACLSDCFICIADSSKKVDALGNFPVAVEVLAEARSYVSREIVKRFQAQPQLRQNFVTNRGNPIIDVYNLDLSFASKIEDQINCIAGVIENGIFSRNRADIALLANSSEVERIDFA